MEAGRRIRLISALGLSIFILLVPVTQVMANQEPYGLPDICRDTDRNNVAFPVTAKLSGNGDGNQARLYATAPGPEEATHQGPAHTVAVYASWRLSANTLTNEADGFSFNVEAKDDPWTPGYRLWDTQETGGAQGGNCRFVAEIYQEDGTAPNFEWFVQAGDWGTTNDWSCTREVHWEITQSIKYTLQDSGGETEISVGGSYSCSDGGDFDSGILFDQKGETSLRIWSLETHACETTQPFDGDRGTCWMR